MQEHVEYAELDIASLTPYEGNARRHNDAKLAESVSQHGQFRTVVVRVQEPPAPRFTLLCGHGTVDALRERGHDRVRCELLRCSDDEALKIVLADNRTSDMADYDEEALARLLEEVREYGWEGSGWDEKSAARYLSAGDEDDGEEDYKTRFEVVVECPDEEAQAAIFEKLTQEGWTCRVLSL